MAAIHYLDFDLLIQREGRGYRAQVVNSPSGQATVQFKIPFSDLELENFILRVGRARRGLRRIDSPEVHAAKNFGEKLFAAVFDGEVRGCFRSSLDEADRQGGGLRIRLRIREVPELADVPWEYLYNPTLNRFLALSVETPVSRYLDLPERIRPLSVKPPLRVLVMISSPKDYPRLDVEREWNQLSESLRDLQQRGLVTLERLEGATMGSLQRRLRRGEYHILHFIGHGGFDQATQDGVLVLEDDAQRGRLTSGQELGTLLHDHRSMRLVILNACEGARSSRTDPFAGTAQSLIQQGLPAVIAMQFEITDEAAITFAHEFYGAVADGYPADAALAEARKAIFAQGNGLEWGTPVLNLRSPDGVIFDVERAAAREPQPEVQEKPKIAEPLAQASPEISRTRHKEPVAKWQLLGGAVLLLLFAGLGIYWKGTRVAIVDVPAPAPAPRIASLTVEADRREIKPKEDLLFKAKARYSDGSEQEVSEGVEWSSNSAAVAVSPDGRAEGQKEGRAEITARYKEVVSSPLTVVVKGESAPAASSEAQVRLVSLMLESSKREIEVQERLNLRARGRYSDGKESDISKGIQWQSTDRAIAGVTAQGQVVGHREGHADITARYAGMVSAPLTLTIKARKEQPVVGLGANKIETASPVSDSTIQNYIKAARLRREQGDYASAFSELEKARTLAPANQEIQAEIEVTKRSCNAERKLGRTDLAC